MSTTDVVMRVREALKEILVRRQDVIMLAARPKSKFEHWLKFELGVALSAAPGIQNLKLEEPFPRSSERSDLSLEVNGSKWYVELKTANTNWQAQGVEEKTRPITKNISSIISDIEKLRTKCLSSSGIAAFVLFPVPTRIWKHEPEKLLYHLQRIEDACKITKGTLLEEAEFIVLDPEFGIALFVVQVI